MAELRRRGSEGRPPCRYHQCPQAPARGRQGALLTSMTETPRRYLLLVNHLARAGHGAAAHAPRPRARRSRPRGDDRLRRGPHRRLRPPARRRPRHRARRATRAPPAWPRSRRSPGSRAATTSCTAPSGTRACGAAWRPSLARRPSVVTEHTLDRGIQVSEAGVVARPGDRAAPPPAGPVDLRDRARRRRPGGGAARGGRAAGQARPHPERRAARPHPRGRRLRAHPGGHRRPRGREGRDARRALLLR